MLKFALSLLYYFRFYFEFFICKELYWMRSLCISFTSSFFLFQIRGGSKKFEDWEVKMPNVVVNVVEMQIPNAVVNSEGRYTLFQEGGFSISGRWGTCDSLKMVYWFVCLICWFADLFVDFVEWLNGLFESMVACFLSVKLVKLDFPYVVPVGLDWRFVKMLIRKRKKREIVNV